MALMMKPGMMEKLQNALANPALMMQDPELMQLAVRMQQKLMSAGSGTGTADRLAVCYGAD